MNGKRVTMGVILTWRELRFSASFSMAASVGVFKGRLGLKSCNFTSISLGR